MSLVAVPPSAPMVITVSVGKVLLPCSVAVTVMETASLFSLKEDGFTLRSMREGASSSSVIVVVIDFEVPRLGAAPPPPEGLDMETVNVSPVPSSMVSSVVWTVNVWSPAAVFVNVSVPDLAV